ncbi:hypothetical protein SH580_17395 [Coraliomargarita algicola]|uniref:Extracellular solute-binding protein n=1 Tax=Coraliomargarita algicola TaxID=3092156 RepID=A0ABZ0RJP6_9BACT|nr:hypothetical protein [Coraliomargarita sp. J2-16]WPJ95200.1 hypothetical protein SH580_17395 [Coraliomargarita sp. J2-16]
MNRFLKNFNLNWIAAALLLGAFIFSAVRFYLITDENTSAEADASGKRVIRIAHWQLEPGFRESMQWAIDLYNARPEVKAANVEIAQLALPSQFYNQFIYVHMISGTAPDIAVKRDTATIKGNALSKFFTPLGSYVDQPNPYNAPEYQVPDLPDELSQFLANSPWRDTYFDGMQSAYDTSLSDYYTIPISSWGGYRVFYNLEILAQVKSFALAAATATPSEEWIQPLWRSAEQADGFIPQAAGQAWLQNDQVPQTLGQFMLYCHAVQAYAKAKDEPYLTPISASSYGPDQIGSTYSSQFLSKSWEALSLDLGGNLHTMEFIAGYERGVWDFDAPAFLEYFKLLKRFTSFYPNGFLGLDREQARRRFVLGQSAIYYAGGWDASSIYKGVNSRDEPEDRFPIEVAPSPIAAPGERWDDWVDERVTEADAVGGVPFAINKRSPNFDWALDFLQFISSHRINEAFNQRAEWLPVIVGAKPPATMQAFIPIVQGFPKSFILNMQRGDAPASIRNAYGLNMKLYLTGDIEATEFQARMSEALDNSNIGTRRAWIKAKQDAIDNSRANDRTLSVERLSAELGSEAAGQRERALFYLGLTEGEGAHVERWWHELYPAKEYPSY